MLCKDHLRYTISHECIWSRRLVKWETVSVRTFVSCTHVTDYVVRHKHSYYKVQGEPARSPSRSFSIYSSLTIPMFALSAEMSGVANDQKPARRPSLRASRRKSARERKLRARTARTLHLSENSDLTAIETN
ncbi:unnamed protein product [Arctia plantaginis]|uniref:Uncharacterized protein n=1 Tax=Arctia plantaginis TaxID=874455 RepID=A0A8S1AP03_ARCPL|nr:unnamed protein product [Arctia plantaginis]CAB3248004.1 unnamed protein product [Arctia plantaginis]